MALIEFDFDNKIDEAQDTLGLVPKETKDDKIDFLKQFKEYWEFEKAFKYNSTFDTTFNKVISQTGLDQDQASEILEDLIGVIVGNAAEKIGLKWEMINDENYLFGFYKADGPSNLPVILVPHKFKFSQVKDKLLDWLIAQKKNQHKKPKMQIVESMSKRVSDKFRERSGDAVSNLFPLDEEVVIKTVDKFFTSTWPSSQVYYNPRTPEWLTIGSFTGYNANHMWGKISRNTYFMKLFSHIEDLQDSMDFDRDYSIVICLRMTFEDTSVKLDMMRFMYDSQATIVSLTPLQAKSFIGGDGVTTTGNSVESLLSVLSFCSDNPELIEEAFNPKEYFTVSNSNNSSISDCEKEETDAINRLIKFFDSNRQEIVDEYSKDILLG
jgi:hypothetical protein